MKESLLVQVKELNKSIEKELSKFGVVRIVSKILNIYSIDTEVENIKEMQSLKDVVTIEKDYEGCLYNDEI